MNRSILAFLLGIACLAGTGFAAEPEFEVVQAVKLPKQTHGYRAGMGDIVALKDGSLLFAYPCWNTCSIGDAQDMKRWVTLFYCRAVPLWFSPAPDPYPQNGHRLRRSAVHFAARPYVPMATRRDLRAFVEEHKDALRSIMPSYGLHGSTKWPARNGSAKGLLLNRGTSRPPATRGRLETPSDWFGGSFEPAR